MYSGYERRISRNFVVAKVTRCRCHSLSFLVQVLRENPPPFLGETKLETQLLQTANAVTPALTCPRSRTRSRGELLLDFLHVLASIDNICTMIGAQEPHSLTLSLPSLPPFSPSPSPSSLPCSPSLSPFLAYTHADTQNTH